MNDDRYKAIKTVQERRDIFDAYVQDKKREEYEEGKIRQKKIREDFFQLLAEIKTLDGRASYRSVVPLIEHDARFVALERDDDRLDCFEDYIYDLEKRQRKDQQEKRRVLMEKYKHLLQQKVEEGVINFATVWRKVQDKIEFDKELDKVDRMIVWDHFMRDLTRQEEERLLRERDKKKKQERNIRKQFWVFFILVLIMPSCYWCNCNSKANCMCSHDGRIARPLLVIRMNTSKWQQPLVPMPSNCLKNLWKM